MLDMLLSYQTAILDVYTCTYYSEIRVRVQVPKRDSPIYYLIIPTAT